VAVLGGFTIRLFIFFLIFKKLTLTIFYQNARGLLSQLTKLYSDSLSFASHINVFTETWLKQEVPFPVMYSIHTYDRPSRRKGKVLIAVRSTITSEQVLFAELRNVEFICVKLSFSDRSVYSTCSYILLSSEHAEYLNHLPAVQFL